MLINKVIFLRWFTPQPLKTLSGIFDINISLISISNIYSEYIVSTLLTNISGEIWMVSYLYCKITGSGFIKQAYFIKLIKRMVDNIKAMLVEKNLDIFLQTN